MQNIHVKRYKSTNPERPEGWLGWVEPEDRSWLLFIDAGGNPTLMLRESVERAPGLVEEAYVNAGTVLDSEGFEVKQVTLHQLGLKVHGFNLKGQFVKDAIADPPEHVVKAKEALDAALKEPGTRWDSPFSGRLPREGDPAG